MEMSRWRSTSASSSKENITAEQPDTAALRHICMAIVDLPWPWGPASTFRAPARKPPPMLSSRIGKPVGQMRTSASGERSRTSVRSTTVVSEVSFWSMVRLHQSRTTPMVRKGEHGPFG